VFDDLRARAALNWGASASDLRDLVAILRDEIDLNLTHALGEANPGRPE
jgi:hypothetical protein